MTLARIPPAGLYWIVQKSPTKNVEHHAILDVGNSIGYADVDPRHPIIVHQTPPSIRRELFADTGTWKVVTKIADEHAAARRLIAACAMPVYSAVGNNCEHFARYIATGVRQSHQLQRIGFIAGVIGFA